MPIEKNETFPLQDKGLENNHRFGERIGNLLTPEDPLWEMTEERVEGFINMDETSYAKLRLFFSDYTPALLENYFRYIKGEKNVVINDFIDVVNYYNLYQTEKKVPEHMKIVSLLHRNGVDIYNEDNFEYTLNKMMRNLRREEVIGEESYKKYNKVIERLANYNFVPEELNYEDYKEYSNLLPGIGLENNSQKLLNLIEKGITVDFIRTFRQVGWVSYNEILHIKEICNEIGEEEALYRIDRVRNMFSEGASALLKTEIIKYPNAPELYDFLERNPQTLKIGEKEIEFSSYKGPINVFRGILKLAKERCFDSLDDINITFLIKEYENTLNDFIEQGKQDYGKVFSLVQKKGIGGRAFAETRSVTSKFDDKYGEKHIELDEKYESGEIEIALGEVENHLKLNPNEKTLLYIGGHAGEGALTKTDIGSIRPRHIEKLKNLTRVYNFEVEFDSCSSGEKTKGDNGSFRGSSLFEDNVVNNNSVIRSLMESYDYETNLSEKDVRNIKKLIGYRMFDRLREINFIGNGEEVDVENKNRVYGKEEVEAANKVMDYLNKFKDKKGDFTGDGKVNWNEATLYKFLKAEYNIIPITYRKSDENEFTNIS